MGAQSPAVARSMRGVQWGGTEALLARVLHRWPSDCSQRCEVGPISHPSPRSLNGRRLPLGWVFLQSPRNPGWMVGLQTWGPEARRGNPGVQVRGGDQKPSQRSAPSPEKVGDRMSQVTAAGQSPSASRGEQRAPSVGWQPWAGRHEFELLCVFALGFLISRMRP